MIKHITIERDEKIIAGYASKGGRQKRYYESARISPEHSEPFVRQFVGSIVLGRSERRAGKVVEMSILVDPYIEEYQHYVEYRVSTERAFRRLLRRLSNVLPNGSAVICENWIRPKRNEAMLGRIRNSMSTSDSLAAMSDGV